MTRWIHQRSLVNRPQATLAAMALSAGALVTTCAPVTPVWSSPTGTPIYVAPFTDQTPQMAHGGVLRALVTEQLYARAPRRTMVLFDEHALALDVTVTGVDDVVVNETQIDVVVRAEAILVDRSGRVVLTTGALQRRGRYQRGGEAGETDRRRRAAVAAARHTLAGAIVDAVLAVP